MSWSQSGTRVQLPRQNTNEVDPKPVKDVCKKAELFVENARVILRLKLNLNFSFCGS